MIRKIVYFCGVTLVLALLAVWFVRNGEELDLTPQQMHELEVLVKARLQNEFSKDSRLIKLDGPSRIEGSQNRSGFFTYRLVNGDQGTKLVVWWRLKDQRIFLERIDR